MHHPPFRTRIGHTDEMGLQCGERALAAIFSRHPQFVLREHEEDKERGLAAEATG
jgi:hypothetical protein